MRRLELWAYRLLTRNGSACQLGRTGRPRGRRNGSTFSKSVEEVELMSGDGIGNWMAVRGSIAVMGGDEKSL